MSDDDKLENLDEMLHKRVTDFVKRAWDRVDTDGVEVAEMTIRLSMMQWDDDDCPVLDASIEEKFHTDDLSGRIPSAIKAK